MKFSITHKFRYTYDSPVRVSTQYLRLTPRDTARQTVLDWSLDTAGQAMRTTDGYGNVLHVLTIDKPVSEIAIQAEGSVETSPTLDEPSDFTGVPLSPLLFLRPTGLTRAGEALGAFAEKFRRSAGTLSGLRELAAAIHGKDPGGSAADASHAFIACCRHLGVPARYVCGYLYTGAKHPNARMADASHAWVQVYLPEVGWKGFDPTNGVITQTDHVRVAVGRNYVDATPTSGTIYVGGGGETLSVEVALTRR